MKLRDVLIVGAIVLLAGIAAAEALVRSEEDDQSVAAETDGGSTTEPERRGPRRRERFPPTRAPGSVVFLDGDRCLVRQVVASSGDELPLEEIDTACELWAPPRGVHVAVRVGGSVTESVPFRFLDLNHPRVDLGGWRALYGAIAWSPDGQRAAWCETTEVGFDLELGSPEGPLATRGCPREYSADGAPVFVSGVRVVAGARRERLFTAGGPVGLVHRGTDGSFAVVAGERLERWEGSRRTHVRPVRPSVTGSMLTFSPDNCAVLANREGVVALIDLGCFRGAGAVTTVSPDNCVDRAEATKSECARYPAPRAFEGTEAAWSPDGEWIAVAQADALSFHRVVGSYALVRWPAEPRSVAWLG